MLGAVSQIWCHTVRTHKLHMATQQATHNYYQLTPGKLGCEVRNIDLKKDVPAEGDTLNQLNLYNFPDLDF